ncbi:BTAD domain-containing putative transcriptional regulator [Actinocorallia longicatena]|uniref:OmpR/PhoB-type domain-containing protein n=1 Tax=Actinocorallia longicatena TaxID=111803 RepID=A0ABP6QK54_9ACTN
MAEIRALGAFEALVGGRPADLGGTRQRAVLARLVAARGRMVPVERLIDDLWVGEAPPRALAGVQSFVSHLRRALEPGRPPRTPAEVLVTSPPGYALRLPAAAVDVWRFEALVAETADPALAWERADEALTLWRGPAFAEFAELPWAEAEAARLTELRLTAIERRAAAMVDHGAAAQAVPDLEAHTAAHPLREEPWRLLALALYRTGRQGDALAALRRIRTLLAEDLGVDPGRPLQRLEAAILAQDPGLTPARSAATGPAARAPERPAPERPAPERPAPEHPAPEHPGPERPEPDGDPFVGRDREVAEVLAAARTGRRVVLLSGEAGAGKTALADRVCRALAADGWEQAWGRTPEVDGAPAAWAWAELLRALTGRHPATGGDLAPMLDDDALTPVGDLTVARFRLHRAIGDYLAGVVAGTRLVIVLEDLHRADEETLSLLAGIADRVPGPLVIGTYRDTEVQPALADALAVLARHEPVRIELAGLSGDDVAELVGGLCGATVEPKTLAAIAERTAGNPFFVRETARLLDASGAESAVQDVPSGVGDVVRRRVARLPAVAQSVLRHAAVVGRETDPELLIAVSGTGEEEVLDAVEAALVTGLLVESGPGLRFTHILVRDVLYGDLSRLRRSRMHARVAEALEERPGADAAALAHHHLAAGTRLDRAVHHARRAAEAAEARFSHGTAAALWSQALDACERAGGPLPERLELVARLIRALAMSGRLMQARERRTRALAAARALGDPELTARLLTAYDVPMLWVNREYGTRDLGVIEAAQQALETLPAGPWRVRLLTTLAMELDCDPADRGGRAGTEAIEIARGLGDPELLAHALNGMYNNLHGFAGGLAERERIGTELLEIAERHGLGLHQVLAHFLLQQCAAGRLDLAASERHGEEGTRLAHQYELPMLAMIGDWGRGLRLAITGRYAEAEAAYQEILEAFLRSSIWGGEIGMAWVAKFTIRLGDGRLPELLPESAVMWETFGQAPIADIHGLVLASAGRLEEARALADVNGDVAPDWFRDLHLAARGLLIAALGDRERAPGLYAELLPYAGGFAGAGTAALALCPVSLVLAELAPLVGEDPGPHYERAVEEARRAGSPHWAERAVNRRSAVAASDDRAG